MSTKAEQSKAYQEGQKAYAAGKAWADNPYEKPTSFNSDLLWKFWAKGWAAKQDEMESWVNDAEAMVS